jgi:hypothetical protein
MLRDQFDVLLVKRPIEETGVELVLEQIRE